MTMPLPSLARSALREKLLRRSELLALSLLLVLGCGASRLVMDAMERMLAIEPRGVWSLGALWVGSITIVASAHWRSQRANGDRTQSWSGWPKLILVLPLAVATGALGALAAWAWTPDRWAEDSRPLQMVFSLATGLATSSVLWLAWCARWRLVAAIAAFTLVLAGWLVWDEPAAATLVELGTVAAPAPQANQSHAATLNVPTGLPHPEPGSWMWRAVDYMYRPAPFNEWRVFVVANRDAIRGDWARWKDAREWIRRLDAFETIGDLTDSLSSPLMKWRPFRSAVFLHCAYASLLAIEDRADEALEVLSPALSVSMKLQPAARTNVRLTIAFTSQSACYHAAQFVLKTGELPRQAVLRLNTVLEPGEAPSAALRRMFLWEGALLSRTLTAVTEEARTWSRWMHPLVYNPQATANLAARYHRYLMEVAGEGRSEGFGRHHQAAQSGLGARSFKNAAGRQIVYEATVLATKIVRFSQATEDQRRALLAEVRKKLAEAENREAEPP